jgi:hypothetical protein
MAELVPIEKQIRIVRLIKDCLNEDPYVSSYTLSRKVIGAIEREFSVDIATAADMYAVCSVELQGYLESGPKLAQCDAILDDVIDKCREGLVTEVERDCEVYRVVNEKMANSVIKAVDTKMKVLANMQNSMIAAKRASDDREIADDTLDLLRAEADELRASLKGNVLANPQLAKMMLERKRMKEVESE